MFNVLFTCAGRRNYLVDYFRQALAGRGEVLAADISPSAPALQEADRAFIVPRIDDPAYLPTLLQICREHQVRLLLSLNDLELPILARLRESFVKIGTLPVISSTEIIDLCFDKLATYRWLQEIGVSTPRTWSRLEDAQSAAENGDLRFPAVIKPRWGTASLGQEFPGDREELDLAWQLGHRRLMRSFLAAVSSADAARCLLVQEKLAGIEYNLDIINDLSGNYVTTFVKRKMAMRVGEGAVEAITVRDPALESLGEKIGRALGHIGNLDCDVFVDGERRSVIDLNPRFGGSYPFTHQAGVNLPAVLVAWVRGEPVDPGWLTMQAGKASAKCDRVVAIKMLERQENLACAALTSGGRTA